MTDNEPTDEGHLMMLIMSIEDALEEIYSNDGPWPTPLRNSMLKEIGRLRKRLRSMIMEKYKCDGFEALGRVMALRWELRILESSAENEQ